MDQGLRVYARAVGWVLLCWLLGGRQRSDAHREPFPWGRKPVDPEAQAARHCGSAAGRYTAGDPRDHMH